jgi:ATPase subunit of ABC transporter with duplicated ATPase domains
MISATGIELRGGHRLLLEGATFRIAPGDRVGLVGRNGSGKTTLTKVLAGVGTPTSGQVTSSGEIGYLPQDPRTGDLQMVARDRILSARGLDSIIRDMRDTEGAMASADDERRDKAMSRYTRLEEQFTARGGYAAESEAPRRSHWTTAFSVSRSRLSAADSAAASSCPGSCSRAPRPCSLTSRPTTWMSTRSCG